MDHFLKRTWAEVSLDCIEWNFQQIRNQLQPQCQIMAVVKADAYGHGAVAVAGTLAAAGAHQLAVATIDEAIDLRLAGIRLPILVLGYTPPELTTALLHHGLTQTVFDIQTAGQFSEYAAVLGQTLKIHVKVDTGMTRLGLLYSDDVDPERTVQDIKDILKMPGLVAEGIFTHFANADVEDDDYTRLQFSRFMDLNHRLEQSGIRFKLRHCANSSAIINFPEMQLDMVRPGIVLYGSYPAESMRTKLLLRQAMTLHSVVSQVKDVAANVTISYGRTYRTEQGIRVAVVEAGYADGLVRCLGTGGTMLIHGQTVPIIGTICMDRCMIDVTHAGTVSPGDIVTIFGTDGFTTQSVDQLAKCAGTISYEVLCQVSKRVPRSYRRTQDRTEKWGNVL